MMILGGTTLAVAMIASPAATQTRDKQEDLQEHFAQPPQPIANPITVGGTSPSAVGKVGQRQTQSQIAPYTQPLARINSRIQNRVQNRIRNRIDRYYDPEANTTSPFTVAADQARAQNIRR